MASDFEIDTNDASPEAMAGAHMEAFRVAEEEADAMDADFLPVGENGEAMEPLPEPDQMSRAAFAAVWTTAWNLPGMMLPEYKPLQITEDKQQPCNEAADALYDLAEMHFPWMLSEQNSTIGAVARLVPFGIVQAGAFRAVLIEKRRAKQEAANANEPPQFKSGRPPEAQPQAGAHDWMDQEAKAA